MRDIVKDLAIREQNMAHLLACGHEIAAFRGNVTDVFGHRCVEFGGELAAQVGLR